MRHTYPTLLATALAAALSATGPASAQNALEEVVVTATKRDRNPPKKHGNIPL